MAQAPIFEPAAMPAPPGRAAIGAVLAIDVQFERVTLIGATGRVTAAALGWAPVLGPDPAIPPDTLADSLPAFTVSGRPVAWLAEPTDRYAHFVLGRRQEAAALRWRLEDGTVLTHRLTPPDVFEDRLVRLVDSDGDGAREALVVRAGPSGGAGLALFAPRGGTLAQVAASPSIGTPGRWMNPVGVGNLDGDGKPEIVAVHTPHIGGWLTVYHREGERLVEKARKGGYSNHRIGAPGLASSALADIAGDFFPEIIVPRQSRRTLAFLRWRDGALEEIGELPLPGEIDALGIGDVDADGDEDLAVSFTDGGVRVFLNRRY